jgi:hypothetical protein
MLNNHHLSCVNQNFDAFSARSERNFKVKAEVREITVSSGDKRPPPKKSSPINCFRETSLFSKGGNPHVLTCLFVEQSRKLETHPNQCHWCTLNGYSQHLHTAYTPFFFLFAT